MGSSIWPSVALSLCLFMVLIPALSGATESVVNATTNAKGRNGRVLSLFQIVRFPNDACNGNANRNGTCYTEGECSDRGGSNEGSCASGYGVCCVFSLGCGSTSSENCTYFQSTGSEAGGCRLRICKCDSSICQLRLDFNTFVVSGPSTATTSSFANDGNIPATTATRCLTDSFAVTNPNGITPPTICGTNTGEHMYVDAADACNDLTFLLGNTGVGTGVSTRQWNIKITQYSCFYDNLAPKGCTQYYFGATTGNIRNYNNQGGRHLASQNQNICIRQERTTCRVCFSTTTANTDFALSGKIASSGYVKGSLCGGYGTVAVATMGYDFLAIIGAEKMTADGARLPNDQFCGRTLATVTGTAGATVCTTRQPFSVRFMSDNYEFGMAATDEAGLASGFNLNYILDSNNCP